MAETKNLPTVPSAPAWPKPGVAHWPDSSAAAGWPVRAEPLSGLGKIAFASLWLLVFAIPWEDAFTIAGFGTSVRAIGLVAVVLGALALVEKARLRRPAPAHLLAALFVVVASLSYTWSLYPEGTLTQTYTYIQLLIMVWLIWEFAVDPQKQIRLMQAYVLGTFVSGLDTVYDFLYHEQSVYERYAGAKLDANDLGLMMALSIPLCYYLLIRSRGKVVWVYRLQLVLAGTTVVLTASRTAMLASTVALAIVPLTHARLTPRKKIAALLTLALLVTGLLIFAPETSWERLSTLPSEFERGTMTGRTVIWAAGWQLFREHPFLGVGANAFRITVSRVLKEPIRFGEASPAPPAHNTFLSVLVEQGIFGFAVFFGFLGCLVASLRDMPQLSRQLWTVCLAVWVVGVSSLTWEMRKPTWFFFGLLMTQAAAWAERRRAPRFTELLMDMDYYPYARPFERAIPPATN